MKEVTFKLGLGEWVGFVYFKRDKAEGHPEQVIITLYCLVTLF